MSLDGSRGDVTGSDAGGDGGPSEESPQAEATRHVIVACPDGPLLVRGDFDIVDPDGRPLPRTRKTVALCRCGASVLKPYCDGSHKLIGFRTEDEQTA